MGNVLAYVFVDDDKDKKSKEEEETKTIYFGSDFDESDEGD
jgi:hypothetical protein